MTTTNDLNNLDTTEFDKIVSYIENTNNSLFLTGKAGTGKTTFLHYLKEKTDKNNIVLAPTGVAAFNCEGVTIHSFFQLPLEVFPPYDYKIETPEFDDRIVSIKHVIASYSQSKKNIINSLELLIIDEVSMVRVDILDAIDIILKYERNNSDLPFGGVQVLLIGDLYQLMPVDNDAWELLRQYKHYGSIYFFNSIIISESQPKHYELKKVFRQTDNDFIKILNRIRINKTTKQDIDVLNSKQCNDWYNNGHTTISTHNNTVNNINESKLNDITKPAKTFSAKITGEYPKDDYPIDAELILKIGARVMFVRNDSGLSRRFYNGMIGTVTDFSEKEITVISDDGSRIQVERAQWEKYIYYYDLEERKTLKKITGVFKQFPLRLAWAITVHKSQGLTLEKINVDLEHSFTHGQLYVALSRCTSLDGVKLISSITEDLITVAPAVKVFSENNKPIQLPDRTIRKIPEETPLLYNLIIHKNFEKYINKLPDQEERIITLDKTDSKKNQYHYWLVQMSKALSRSNNDGGKRKAKFINSVISYLTKNNYFCNYIIESLYSKSEEYDYTKKTEKLKNSVKHKIKQRNKYLTAFNKVRSYYDVSNAIKEHFKNEIDYDNFKNARTNNYKSLHSIFLESSEGRQKTNILELEKKFVSFLDNNKTTISEKELKRIWVDKEEHLLSLNHLKVLSNLIVKAYNTIYDDRISNYRKENYRESDKDKKRESYIRKSKFSAKEKREYIIKNYRKKTNNEIADYLDCSTDNVRKIKNKLRREGKIL